MEATDPRYQKLTVGRILLEQVRKRLDGPDPKPALIQAPPSRPSYDGLNILRALDLSPKLDKPAYLVELEKYQGRLNLLTRHKAFKDHSVILVFEGTDAAGKGGSIRRITQAVDARLCTITPDRRPHRGGAGPALPLALLAQPAPAGAGWPSSTAAGTAGCWWSGSRASAPSQTGCAPTGRSTTSRSRSTAAAGSS